MTHGDFQMDFKVKINAIVLMCNYWMWNQFKWLNFCGEIFRGMCEYKKSMLFIYSSYSNIHKQFSATAKYHENGICEAKRQAVNKFACRHQSPSLFFWWRCQMHTCIFRMVVWWMGVRYHSLDFCFRFIWHSNKMVCFCLAK